MYFEVNFACVLQVIQASVLCLTAHNWQKWKSIFLENTTKKHPIITSYTMNTDFLEHVTHHPYLGVEISHNLKWSLHIDNIIAKANKALWFVRRNLWRCPQKVKEQLYFALVRPHLEFACAVWDPCTNTDIQRLEMIQHRAARFVTKNYSRAPGSITKILEQLQWPTLEQRRKQCRLINMYKIQKGTTAIPIPDYIYPASDHQ